MIGNTLKSVRHKLKFGKWVKEKQKFCVVAMVGLWYCIYLLWLALFLLRKSATSIWSLPGRHWLCNASPGHWFPNIGEPLFFLTSIPSSPFLSGWEGARSSNEGQVHVCGEGRKGVDFLQSVKEWKNTRVHVLKLLAPTTYKGFNVCLSKLTNSVPNILC